jgi:RNA polymerase sigma-70 factor (ECF subfamily)
MERNKDKYLSDSDIVRIVETYSDMLLRIALNRVKSLPAAEDIVQSVFERLMRRRPIFESREHEKAWLIRTAVNLCLTDLRKQSRHGELPLDENIAGEFGDDSYEVLDAVQTLPVQDRYAVYLYYYEGYTIQEIGQILKKSPNTVSSWLTRARKKLKAILME